MKPAALLLSLLLCACPALAQEAAFEGPQVVRARGILTLSFRVEIPGDERAYTGTIAGNGASVPVTVDLGADGKRAVELRTARLLLDGSYELRLKPAPGGKEIRFPFQLGSAEEAKAAAERMDGWYLGAVTTFRSLSAALERRGAYHRARATADAKLQPAEQERLKGVLLEWEYSLRMARMDLATCQRRLLLPPRPEVVTDLVKLVDLLQARAAAWIKALEPFGEPPAANNEIEAVAARLLAVMKRPAEELTAWGGGPTSAPPPVAKPGGVHRSPRGFSLAVPAGAKILPTNDPTSRLEFVVDGMQVVVYVFERYDARTPAQLQERVEVDAWERWDSYKRLTGGSVPGSGYQLEFTAEFRGARVRARQLNLWPKAGGRLYSLILFRTGLGDTWPASAKTIESSFQLTGGGP